MGLREVRWVLWRVVKMEREWVVRRAGGRRGRTRRGGFGLEVYLRGELSADFFLSVLRNLMAPDTMRNLGFGDQEEDGKQVAKGEQEKGKGQG